MKILTNENKAYELDTIPNEIEDIRYCVLDYSDVKNPDYYFIPLIFLESFYAPAVVINIGNYSVQMPLDWSILVCDEDYSDLELMPLTSLNDRGFYTMAFNPLRHMVPRPQPINITNVYSDIKWYFPKLKNGNILVVPLDDRPHPDCALFVKEVSKLPDVIDIGVLFE
ncbi:MAG TPA: hypothetical protein VIY47_02030 [Ignavibacteriaceae bacterium]